MIAYKNIFIGMAKCVRTLIHKHKTLVNRG